MNIRFFTILIILSSFYYSKQYTCSEIEDLIVERYDKGEYDIAYNMAKKNKTKEGEGCDAFFYVRLANIFKKFDDFKSTRELYNTAMKKSTEEEYKTINLEYKKLSFLSSQINFIQSVYLSDGDKEKALSNYKDLINGNEVWDNGEPFIDSNQNMGYDDGEDFTDWSFDDIGLLHLYIADIYKNSEDYTNATLHLNIALNINPYVKKYNEYMTIISKLIAKKGNDFLRLNKIDQAIEQYNLSLSIDSSESSIHYNLANAYFKKDNFEDAIISYKNVINLEPDKFKATHKVGVCYQKLGLHEEAVIEFKNAIGIVERLEEKFMSPYHSLGISFMELGNYKEAIQILNDIIGISSKYYKAYETLGIIHSEAEDPAYINYDLALDNFIEASNLKPDNHTIKFRLAQLYNIMAEDNKENSNTKEMEKNFAEAKKYARQCIKLKKTYGGAYFELGVAELNLCNKSSSLKALKKAAKYDRRYRSEVKRIIKKVDSIMNHCE